MKVLLIDVGTSRRELNEPLGIEVLAGVIRHHYPEMQVDLEYYQLFDASTTDLNYLFEYDIIGISTQLFSLKKVEIILDLLLTSTNKKKPLVILGGLLATFAYDYFLKKYPECICVIGEGEDAIISVLKMYIADTKMIKEGIAAKLPPNIAIIYNDQIFCTPRQMVNLEKSIKPARDLLPQIIMKRGIIRIEGSRGCPWGRCSFCAISAKYGGISWRPFPVNKIIDELEEISLAGGRSPYFTDEDFFGSKPKRALEIAENIIIAKRQGKINKDLDFYFNLSINSVISHKDILIKLKEAGLREVFIGIESGTGRQIQRYKKIATKKRNIEALNILRDLELSIDLGFIMFDPEMSFDDLKDNIKFIEEAYLINHDAREIKKVRIEPYTSLEKKLKKCGVITSSLDVDGLRYPYLFIDPFVQKVYDTYNEWEMGARDFVYILQGQMRGEIKSESIRRKQKILLGEFRKLDYKFLQVCIDYFDTPRKSTSDFKDIQEDFINRRNDIINMIKSERYDDE